MTLDLAAIFGPIASEEFPDRATDSVSAVAVETDRELTKRSETSELEGADRDGVDALGCHDSPSVQLSGLCRPPAQPFDPGRQSRVLTVCDRCQCAEYVDVPIHGGASTRRDCQRCSRFMGWPKWYGQIQLPPGPDRVNRDER